VSKGRSNRTSPLALALRKFFVSGFVIVSFVAYAVHERLVNAGPAISVNAPANEGTQLQSLTPQTIPTVQPTVPLSQQIVSDQRATATPADLVQGQYKDGIYAGASEDAFYGMVEVQATVQNGLLIDVQFLDYPHDRRTSQRINQQAMPYLIQEAIHAQKTPTNAITGATLTSVAFEESLADALSQARNS